RVRQPLNAAATRRCSTQLPNADAKRPAVDAPFYSKLGQTRPVFPTTLARHDTPMDAPQRSKMLAALGVTALLTAAFVYEGRAPLAGQQAAAGKPLVFSSYKQQLPGTMHKITPADLPAPNEPQSGYYGPKVVARPAGAMPKTMSGFTVTEYATGLKG